MQIKNLAFCDIEKTSSLLWESFYHTQKDTASKEGLEHFHEYSSPFFLSMKMADPSLSFFGAYENGELIGVSALKDAKHVLLLYVKPSFFKMRVGSSLLSHMEGLVEEEEITVNSSDHAISFYQKKGYVVCGKRTEKEGLVTTPMKKIKGLITFDALSEAICVKDYVVSCRRHVHENPELSDLEDNTVRFILDELNQMNIRCFEVPGAGVIAHIPGKCDGKKLLLRADIDALPIAEAMDNGGAFPKACVSHKDGVSHACGHDSHTAMLLGAAHILSRNTDAFGGEITLFFERGEENGNGDVHMKNYMEENHLSYDGAWALHVNPRIDSGVIGISEGGVYAAGIFFSTELKKGDNANASPSEVLASLIRQLEAARATRVSPFESLTLSVCRVSVEGDTLRVGGTCRFHDRESGGFLMHGVIQNIIESTAFAYDYTIIKRSVSNPAYPVVNHRGCCQLARRALSASIGEKRVCEGGRSMGSESFRLFSSRFPSVLASLGTRNVEKGIIAELHTPQFEVCEDALPIGVAATVSYALSFLADSNDIPFDTKE